MINESNKQKPKNTMLENKFFFKKEKKGIIRSKIPAKINTESPPKRKPGILFQWPDSKNTATVLTALTALLISLIYLHN